VTDELVTLDDIRMAAERVRPLALTTPLLGPFVVDESQRGSVWLKCENLQPMGAFKIRGAANLISQLTPAERAAGVITYSSGNHGQAVALVAAHFHIPAVVVMPTTAPAVKVDGVRRHGAEVILEGTTSTERLRRARQEAASRGLIIVPPFDHRAIIAGAGTVGLEILRQQPQATAVYVPVGGGGLLSGVAAAVKGMRQGVRVVGVEPTGAAKMSRSIAAGEPITLDSTSSMADGLLPVRPGDLTFAHARALVDEVITVPEEAIAEAVRWLFATAKVVAEPSGAVAVAGALAAREPAAVAVVSGGNVSAELFASLVSQA
jgi:threonine dehydratase